MHIKGRFSKTGQMRLLGHLDLLNLFRRALKRAGVEVEYSQGFNPSPKLSIGNPLSLGVESNEEFIEFTMLNALAPDEMKEKINRELPEGISIIDLMASEDTKSLTGKINFADYQILIPYEQASFQAVQEAVSAFEQSSSVIIEKMKKNKKTKKKTPIDYETRDKIHQIDVREGAEESVVRLRVSSGQSENIRPDECVRALQLFLASTIDFKALRVVRAGQYQDVGGTKII